VTPVLELAAVSKEYRGLRPLRIELLRVNAGDQVAILGFDQPSAEVFVNLVTGTTLPDKGTVAAFGLSTADIADSADWLAVVDRFGIVSGRAVLLDKLSVTQNLAMPITLDIEPPSSEVLDRVAVLAGEVGLADRVWGAAVASLGPDAHARIRLGRALALDPAVLLLEHMSARLDPGQAAAFGADVRGIAERRGIAVVAATADEVFAHAVASRVLALEPATGRLREHGRRGWFGRRLGSYKGPGRQVP
jgi:ABC-type transporter Mla maintaining outer membrane lipid asymmetry ATPase subunit MlaF